MAASRNIDSVTESTIAAVERLDEAIRRRNVDEIMTAMTEDCIFETTFPAPDGQRYEGHDAVRGAMEDFLRSSPQARFDTEELFACGDRAVLRWTYHWVEADGTPGHVRGVDVIRVRNGKVSESLAYVKG
jgi:ketosteroid isomerase-like protein